MIGRSLNEAACKAVDTPRRLATPLPNHNDFDGGLPSRNPRDQVPKCTWRSCSIAHISAFPFRVDVSDVFEYTSRVSGATKPIELSRA